MTLAQANEELCRYRNAALTVHGRLLIAAGADVDGEEFRQAMLEYGGDLEKWRRESMNRIERLVKAAAEMPSETVN